MTRQLTIFFPLDMASHLKGERILRLYKKKKTPSIELCQLFSIFFYLQDYWSIFYLQKLQCESERIRPEFLGAALLSDHCVSMHTVYRWNRYAVLIMLTNNYGKILIHLQTFPKVARPSRSFGPANLESLLVRKTSCRSDNFYIFRCLHKKACSPNSRNKSRNMEFFNVYFLPKCQYYNQN